MKAVEITKPHELNLIEASIPVPPKGFARIKVMAAAICATDLEAIEGNIAANYPLVPGHEWSGIVDAVGSPEDANWLGKAVVGSSDVICGECEACKRGEWRYCPSFEEIGFKRNGAYAEYMLAPVYGLSEKPEHISFSHAALCEPLGVALGTMKKCRVKDGESLLVFGAGSIGLCMVAAGKALGLKRIAVCDMSESRLEVAKKLGAERVIVAGREDIEAVMREYHKGGSDIVIDATGAEECIQKAFRLARKGGTVALAGYGRGKVMNIRIDDIHINNLKVIGAGNNWNMHSHAIALMADGRVDLTPLISKEIKLEEYKDGLKLVKERPEGFLKAVFVND